MLAVTTRLSFGGDRTMVVQFQDIHLLPGVASHQLRVDAKVSARWLPEESTDTVHVLVMGTLHCVNRGIAIVGSLLPSTWQVRGHPDSQAIATLMSDEQLLALDQARNGGDLMLLVELEGIWLEEPRARIAHGDQASLALAPGEWSTKLDQLGREVSVVIRVPSRLVDPGGLAPLTAPGAPAIASRAQAAARLCQARTELLDGRYEHCVATCRMVLDSLAQLHPLAPRKATLAKDPEHRDQEERWSVLYYDVLSLLSMAHHDDSVTREATWNRQDAEAVLATVAGLATRVLSAP